jgi:hypothetical protein
MVVRKVFCIRIRTFVQVHRIAFAFRIRIAFFTLFSHFRTSLTFFLHFSQLVHQNLVKSAKKCEKIAKKCEKCEKVQNANAMQKWNQNSHRTTTGIFFRIFALFCIAFASHYHPWFVPQTPFSRSKYLRG